MNPQHEITARRCFGARCLAALAVVTFLMFTVEELLGQSPPSENTVPRSAVHALAHLEPQSGLVMVGARPGVRILKIEVKEGDVVEAGGLMATLEGNEQAQRQVALAVAQKKRTLEMRSRAREKAQIERRQIDSTLALQRESLVSQVEITKKKNATAQGLYAGLSAIGGVAKLSPKDQIELEAALYLLQMQTLKSELALNELDARKESLADQRKLEDRELEDGGTEDELLDRQIELAQAALDQTFIRATSPGTVLSVSAHAGEVSTGQLLTLGDLSRIVANAEVDQSDVRRLRVGDPARVSVFDQIVPGKVTHIGGLVGSNQMRSVDPRAAQDIRVVHVTIGLETPEFATKFLGMQVEVAIGSGQGGASGRTAPASP